MVIFNDNKRFYINRENVLLLLFVLFKILYLIEDNVADNQKVISMLNKTLRLLFIVVVNIFISHSISKFRVSDFSVCIKNSYVTIYFDSRSFSTNTDCIER